MKWQGPTSGTTSYHTCFLINALSLIHVPKRKLPLQKNYRKRARKQWNNIELKGLWREINSFLNSIQSSALISKLRSFSCRLVKFSFYKSLKLVFGFRICSKTIIGELHFGTFKWRSRFSSSFILITRIYRIMNKMADSVSDKLTPPSIASHPKCWDSQILVILWWHILWLHKVGSVLSFFLVIFLMKWELKRV